MEQLYQDYKDIAEFRLIYINEAHPADGGDPAKFAKEKGLKRHTSFNDRCVVAEMLVRDKQLTIPCLIDGMDNAADLAYSAWPDKIFLVRKDGKLAVAGEDGPIGFIPALKETESWLKEYRESGKEPAIAEAKSSDFRIAVAGENRPDGPQDEFLSKAQMSNENPKSNVNPAGSKTQATAEELNEFLKLAAIDDPSSEQLMKMAELRDRIRNLDSLLVQAIAMGQRELRKLNRELKKREKETDDVADVQKKIDSIHAQIELGNVNLELFDKLSDGARARAMTSADELRKQAEEKRDQKD